MNSNELHGCRQASMHASLYQVLLEAGASLAAANQDNFAALTEISMAAVGRAVGADRVYVFEYNFVRNICSNTFEWCREGIESQIRSLQEIELDLIPDWVNSHVRGVPIYVDNVARLTADSSVRQMLEQQGVKSLLTVPMFSGHDCVGFVGFDSVTSMRSYDNTEQLVLSQFANTLNNTRLRIESDQALAQREIFYRTIMGNLSDIICTMDMNLNTTYISPAVERLTGFSMERYLKMPIHEKHPPESVRQMSAALLEELEREKDPSVSKRRSRLLELKHFCADGRILDLSVSFSLMREENGEPWGILGASRDITTQRSLQAQLEASENKHRILFETMAQGVVYQDRSGTITSANPAAERILGLTQAQMHDKAPADLLWHSIREDGADFPQEEHPTMLALRTGRAVGPVTMGVFQPQFGKYTWLSVTATPLFAPGDENPQQVYATFDDITEAKKTNEDYRALFEKMLDGFALHEIICDEEGTPVDYRFLAVNPAFERITGLAGDDIIGKTLKESLPGEDAKWIDIYGKVALTGESTHFMDYSAALDKHFEITVYRPGPKQFVCIFADITERVKSESALRESEARFKNIMDSMQDIVFTLDDQRRHTGVYGPWVNSLGLTADHFLGRSSAEMMDADSAEVHIVAGRRALQGEFVVYEWSIPGPKHRLYYQTSLSPIKDDAGNISGLVGIGREVTELKVLENSIFQERERLRTTLLSIGDGVISTDTEGKVRMMNKVAEELTGWKQDEALGLPMETVFCIINEFTREACENPVKQVLESGDIIELANHTLLVSKHGNETPIEDSAAPIRDAEGNITGVVLVFRDFTEKKEKQDRILFLSFHDQLTGLYNRRFFEEELRRLDTPRNLPLTLTMLDINGLKLINDAFGHDTGDEVLRKVAESIRQECRADDIVARIGGDEFVLLLPKTDNDPAGAIAERIEGAISAQSVESINLSVSYGWETKRSPEQEMSTIFKRAEDHMYRRKLTESSSMRYRTITTIIRTLHEKNKREEEHSHRVGQLCADLGMALGMSSASLGELQTLGLMHDIGKIAISEDVLNKSASLSDGEWLQIRRHPEIGYNILSSVNEFAVLADYVLAHHERWDGKGYPRGLEGNAIALQARIIAIADAYDAMTSHRPYKTALSQSEAMAELRRYSGSQFDPDLVEKFCLVIEQGGE